MAVREERHPRRRLRRRVRRFWSWVPEIVVVLLVVSAAANLQYDLGHRWLGLEPAADPQSQPAQVLPPEGLDLAGHGAAGAVATSSPGGSLDSLPVRTALAPYVSAAKLGGHVDVYVSELASGRVAYRHGSGAVTPASTMKLLTTTAALRTLGPETRFRTSVRATGDRVVLVGGGDPFLMSDRRAAKGLYPARADLDTLAARSAAALAAQGLSTVRLSYDASMFTGPQFNPAWPATYLSGDVVPRITALWVDEAKGPDGRYVADPPHAAADVFAAALVRHGIVVRGPIAAGRSASAATELASVQSAPLGQIVERTLAVSDNNAAEVIARHVGIAVRQDGSFTGGAGAVVQVLNGLGVDTHGAQVYDGSGLSRRDRLTPETLLGVLQTVSSTEHPDLRDVVTGLPVAGFTGSLQWRFDDAPAVARGRVRAKTGTLTGVQGLAGIVTDVQGNRMAFVAIADRVAVPNTLAARHTLDLIAAALAACSCGAVG
jgi:D-alanyl-D-alanine carboxypeptidase/D-alanyl-D-alanine-endopeptidase (penicillin-binding protein 4)